MGQRSEMNSTDATAEQIIVDEGENDLEKQMLQSVLDDLKLAETERFGYEQEWDRYQLKYKCILESGKYPWRSKVFDPESYSVVETIAPRINNTIFGGAEIFGIKATGSEDVQKAENTERLLNFQADRMNLYEVGGMGVKTSLIEGTGHWKFRWAREFEPRYEEVPNLVPMLDESGQPQMNEQGGVATEVQVSYKKTWEIVYDNPRLDWVDNRDIYVDPLAVDVTSARYVIHRTYRTMDYLKKKALEGVYSNVDKIKPMVPVAEGASPNDKKDKKVDRNTITFTDSQLEDVEILERWGLFDIDGDGYLEECVITVANRSVILAADYNKFPGAVKPFLRFTPIPMPGKYYGMSALQPIDTIQDALNDRTNQVGDAINLTINPMYKKSKWSDIDDDDLVSRPGGVVEMNALTDLEPLNAPILPSQAFAEIGRYENIVQKATGTFDVSRGSVAERQETATTTIALQNVAEIRFKTMAILAERQVIRPLGSMMIKYNKVYMTQPKQIRVLGRDFMLDPSTAAMQGPMGMPGQASVMGGGPMGGGMMQPQAMPQANPMFGGGDQFLTVSKDTLVDDPDIYAVGAALEVGASKDMQLNNILKFLQIVSNPVLMQNPLYSINFPAIIERIPYLMNLKLKQPAIMQGNPMLAYQEIQQEKQLADGMMVQQMQQQMAPQEGPPSRTKGELKKSEVDANKEDAE